MAYAPVLSNLVLQLLPVINRPEVWKSVLSIAENIKNLHDKAWENYDELCRHDKALTAKLGMSIVEVSHTVSQADLFVAALEDFVAAGTNQRSEDKLRRSIGERDLSFIQEYTDMLLAHLTAFQMHYEDFKEQCDAARRACVEAEQECAQGARDTNRLRTYAKMARRGGQAAAVGGGVGIVGAVAGAGAGLAIGPVGAMAVAGGVALLGGADLAAKMKEVAKEYERLGASFRRTEQRFQELEKDTLRLMASLEDVKAELEKSAKRIEILQDGGRKRWDEVLLLAEVDILLNGLRSGKPTVGEAAAEIKAAKVTLYSKFKLHP